jgi:methyl-accepting chemotaxis protein
MLISAAVNWLKSLGPNDKLVRAVSDLDTLLRAEQAIILAQINKCSRDIQRQVRESNITGKKIDARTETMNEGIQQTRKISGQLIQQTTDVQQSVRETSVMTSNIDQRTTRFLHAMNRMEARSVSSQSSIEHIQETLESLRPNEEGKYILVRNSYK